MELTQAVRRRRMVRRFNPGAALEPGLVRDLVELATRAPSAGFTQGWEFLALEHERDRRRFWDAATPPAASAAPDAWLTGVRAAPALILCLADQRAYLDRYAEPDKGWSDRSLTHWPIPYWDTDTAMAALLILLGATDRGVGSLFFGVPAGRHEAVKEAHGIPARLRIVGVVALGHAGRDTPSPSLRRGRRGVDEVLHVGGFGESAAAPSVP